MGSDLSPALEELVEAYDDCEQAPLSRRELHAEVGVGLAFFAAAVALALTADVHVDRSLALVGALVLSYAVLMRIRFTVGFGYTAPTQIVLVPMLLLLPPALAPLLVFAGCTLGNLPDYLAGRRHPSRALVAAGDSWHAVGPALVLVAAGAEDPSLAQWPVYAAALAGQADPAAALLPIPLAGLFALFARERQSRIDNALELSRAYRGTTLLLSDVLEADDEYTGTHSRDVVSLAVAVADEMGLDSSQRRNVEFGALLHDVGKIAVPSEIINKRGPLTDEEWTVIKTHTVEGQRMLDQVGGVLSDVGAIVRSSHERWDGAGYPDGLLGPEIPLESSVVSCCDAYDAMTTDRPYRSAMAPEVALEELLRNSGTQFRPEVVEAVTSVVEKDLRVRGARRLDRALAGV